MPGHLRSGPLFLPSPAMAPGCCEGITRKRLNAAKVGEKAAERRAVWGGSTLA